MPAADLYQHGVKQVLTLEKPDTGGRLCVNQNSLGRMSQKNERMDGRTIDGRQADRSQSFVRVFGLHRYGNEEILPRAIRKL